MGLAHTRVAKARSCPTRSHKGAASRYGVQRRLGESVRRVGLARCDYDRWFDKFKPKQNKKVYPNGDGPFDGCMFETYGDELKEVLDQDKKDPKLVWTLLDCDGKLYIAPGYHYVNRMGYFITTVPFTDKDVVGRAYFAG